ncbi:MAG: hypothetical protein U5R48_18205 [Gammaproteobacteria bacterium]|nr:hypothetical protein [Gammaproteobacteria bacterium]
MHHLEQHLPAQGPDRRNKLLADPRQQCNAIPGHHHRPVRVLVLAAQMPHAGHAELEIARRVGADDLPGAEGAGGDVDDPFHVPRTDVARIQPLVVGQPVVDLPHARGMAGHEVLPGVREEASGNVAPHLVQDPASSVEQTVDDPAHWAIHCVRETIGQASAIEAALSP